MAPEKNQDRYWVTSCKECVLCSEDDEAQKYYCEHPKTVMLGTSEEPLDMKGRFPVCCPLHEAPLVVSVPMQLRQRTRYKNGVRSQLLPREIEKQAQAPRRTRRPRNLST